EERGGGKAVAVASPVEAREEQLFAFPIARARALTRHRGDVAVVFVERTIDREQRRSNAVERWPPPARPARLLACGRRPRRLIRLARVLRDVLEWQQVGGAAVRVPAQDTV